MLEGNYKGTMLVYLRKQIRDKGSDAEERLLSRLGDAEREMYSGVMPINWVDIAAATRIVAAASDILYLGRVNRIEQLGRDAAKYDLTGMYKMLLRVVSVPYAIEKSARLWSTYHKRGEVRVEHEKDANKAIVQLVDYPDMPRDLLPNIAGYIAGIIEMTGGKQVTTETDSSNPSAWRFEITWQ